MAHKRVKGVKKKFLRQYTNIVYLFRSEGLGLLKIGISCNVLNRLSKLNENIPNKTDHFCVVDFIQFETASDAVAHEKRLHTKFKDYQIPTDILGAKTECFNPEIIDLVLKDMYDTRQFTWYDPFISVSNNDATEILGVTFKDYCKSKGIKSEGKILKVKHIFRNLAANIVVSNGKHIHYNPSVMSHIGVESGTTFKVFEDFIPPYSYVDYLLTRDYEVLITGMRLEKRPLTFKRLSGHMFMKMYSMTQVELTAKTHIAYKAKVIEHFSQVMGSADNCIVEVK